MRTESYSRADIMAVADTAAPAENELLDPNLPPDSQPLPMKDILAPTNNDVLCGRGGAVLRHPGNVQYQNLIKERQPEYTTCMKADKLKISRSIVDHVRQEFRGRFLVRDSTTKSWYDIGEKKAIEKTSQALREGQPKRWEKIREAKATLSNKKKRGKSSKEASQRGSTSSLISDDGTQASTKSKKFQSIKKIGASFKVNLNFEEERASGNLDSSTNDDGTDQSHPSHKEILPETLGGSHLSLSERSNQTGHDSWGDYNDSANTLLAGNIATDIRHINLLPTRTGSDYSLDISDEDLLRLSATEEMLRLSGNSALLRNLGVEATFEDSQVPTNSKGMNSFRRRLSTKANRRGSHTTYNSSDRMSEFSAIGSRMSLLSIDDEAIQSIVDGLPVDAEQKPVNIWDANESGMPIDCPSGIQTQHEQHEEMDRRQVFANMKRKNRSYDRVKNSSDRQSRPPSTVVLNPDGNESKESFSKVITSSYTMRSMYKDSLGTFNPESMSTHRRNSLLSKNNQSSRSGISVMTNLSMESIGTSAGLLSVCDAIHSIESGSVGGKNSPLEIPSWNSNRNGFNGPPIPILAEFGVDDYKWTSKNTFQSKDSKSNSSNSQSNQQSENDKSSGRRKATIPKTKSSKIPTRRVSKALSDLSIGTFNTSSISSTSLIKDELPPIEGSISAFYASSTQMDVD